MVTGIKLIPVSKSDPELRRWMILHYSSPRGFVGRQLIYKVYFDEICYGAIAGGSATRFLPGRNEFFGSYIDLNNIINNTFFHIEKVDDRYPIRNFTSKVVEVWRRITSIDWLVKYGDSIFGFETLVELPRTGELYRRDGWTEVGVTKGLTCKRWPESVFGKSTDSWGGKRVWDRSELRPKKVFVRSAD